MHYLNNYMPGISFGGGLFAGLGGIFVLVIVAWSAVWKGLALWRAAREGSKPWFIALLIVNTVGILEILYLYVFSKKAKLVEEKKGE